MGCLISEDDDFEMQNRQRAPGVNTADFNNNELYNNNAQDWTFNDSMQRVPQSGMVSGRDSGNGKTFGTQNI
jgi:hypothetical protein